MLIYRHRRHATLIVGIRFIDIAKNEGSIDLIGVYLITPCTGSKDLYFVTSSSEFRNNAAAPDFVSA